jgi:hypothetical protein
MADIALEMPEAGAPDATLGTTFRRFGQTGFWLQFALGMVPAMTAAMVFLFLPSAPPLSVRGSVVGALSLASLGLLAFTTLWFFLYMRLGRRLEEGAAWTRAGLMRRVKVGLAASIFGILFATIVILFEVGYLLFVFLDAPQGGMPVIATDPTGASWISAADMLSLLALNFTVTAEVGVLALSLLLLWRVSLAGPGPGAR